MHLAPGTYRVNGLRLGDGVQLIGSGSATVLRPDAGSNYGSVLKIRGAGVSVRDLAIDGNGRGQTGGAGRAIEVGSGARDVVIRSVRILDARSQGVYLSGDHQRVSIQDSAIDGGGNASAGVMDRIDDPTSGDTSVLRTTIRNVQELRHQLLPVDAVAGVSRCAGAGGGQRGRARPERGHRQRHQRGRHLDRRHRTP